MTRAVLAKLVHEPTVLLKETAGTPGRTAGGGTPPAVRPLRAVEPLRLATRGSPLALRQAQTVAEVLARAHPGLAVEPVVVRTSGDRQSDVPSTGSAAQGIFAKEVQAAVADGRADVAVHSAKDLPSVTPDGLVLAAVRPGRPPPTPGWPAWPTWGPAPPSPPARPAAGQLANARPDLTFVELRGNMGTRLDRAADGSVDAVVVAVAALERLGWTGRITEVLATSVMLPQVGQGALALECRAGDDPTAGLLVAVDDPEAHRTLAAERAFLRGRRELHGCRPCAAACGFGHVGQLGGRVVLAGPSERAPTVRPSAARPPITCWRLRRPVCVEGWEPAWPPAGAAR